jgi:hypothetical protein
MNTLSIGLRRLSLSLALIILSAATGATDEARSGLPAPPRQRRGGSLPRCELRLRHFGVRRMPVGRSAALGSRGRTPAAPGRPAGLPRSLVMLHRGLVRVSARAPWCERKLSGGRWRVLGGLRS